MIIVYYKLVYVANITPKVLGQLAPDAAVDLFRELLWAEAFRLGIGPGAMSTPSVIYAPDGGIDAEVAGVPENSTGGLLYPGLTRYQVKTGAFSASNQAEMKALFMSKDGLQLKSRIRSCLEKNGTFVAVLFGSDVPDRTDDDLEKACLKFIAKQAPEFRHRRVKILRQNQIAGFINRYPSLADLAGMRKFPNLRTHPQWRGELESMGALETGPPQEAFINQIRSELRQPIVKHVCVWGEPGVGKTRLVYEATAPEDLSSLIAYFSSPKALEQSGVVDELVNDDSKSGIVIVDDCESRDQKGIWRQLNSLGSRVRLVTIQHDQCESSGTTVALQTPELGAPQISAIIQQYGVQKSTAERLAGFCGGSPRVADVVGWNIQNNPDDLTRPLDKLDIWDRFVEATDSPSSESTIQRKTVLQYLSLFRKFGYGEAYSNEAKAIAAQITAANPAITWRKFEEIVHSLRKRRILQGETTLYITPKLLHIKLWSDWWEVHGANLNIGEFLAAVPDSLHQWFYEMFAYAHGSETIRKTIRSMLSREGSFFKQGLIKTQVGANFFLSLTEADTLAALKYLESTIGEEGDNALFDFEDGRQRIVWSLEKIAVERSLFPRAARILLRLAENENARGFSNNATGTFVDLFSLGPGPTAPTQAPPSERLPILKEALRSTSPKRRALALQGFDKALQSQGFVRTYGAERRGLTSLKLWTPTTYSEWFDAYRETWELLRSELPNLAGDDLFEAGKILLKHSFGLVQMEPFSLLVTETVGSLLKIQGIPRKTILETAADVLERLELPKSIRAKWERIRRSAAGGHGFSNRLKSQVMLEPWHFAGASSPSSEPWQNLAEEAVAKPNEFLSQVAWLTTEAAQSAGPFGYELGKADRKRIFLESIVREAVRTDLAPNTTLLGGYLKALKETDSRRWLSTIRSLAKIPDPTRVFPSIIMVSGLTNQAADVLSSLIRRGAFPAHYLRGFIFGGEIGKLSPNKFTSWIEILKTDDTRDAIAAAVQLLHHYSRQHGIGKLPEKLVESALLHEKLFLKEHTKSRQAHYDFDWAEVAKPYLGQNPNKRLKFAKELLLNLGHDSMVLSQFGTSYGRQVLERIAVELPSQVWKIAARLIGPPVDDRAYSIVDWLQGGSFSFRDRDRAEAIINKIPRQKIFEWVDADVDRRAGYLASFVPKPTADMKLLPLTRELLIRYGDRKDVQQQLIANYSREGWVGPESLHQKGKREALERLLESEPEPKVREWLQRYIEALGELITSARQTEERRGF